MGDFHRTYSKVWWPNLDIENSLSPSSSPSSSNGSHRSQDSGFSDSSTSKNIVEQLRNFAHTPDSEIQSSPEPCEDITEENEEENIILPESQYSETPIRSRRHFKTNIQNNNKDNKQNNSFTNSSLTIEHPDPMLQESTNLLKKSANQNSQTFENKILENNIRVKQIENEKLNYCKKKENRKSLNILRKINKKTNHSDNRLSLSLNLVTNQNDSNSVNPDRLYQSYSEQNQKTDIKNQKFIKPYSQKYLNPKNDFGFEPWLPNNSTSTILNNDINEDFRSSTNDVNRTSPIINDRNEDLRGTTHNRTRKNINYQNQNSYEPNCSNLENKTQELENNSRYEIIQHSIPITSTPIHSNERNGILLENLNPRERQLIKNLIPNQRENLNPSERQSLENVNLNQRQILNNLNQSERQLLENLTVNYLNKSSIEKNENIYENLKKNLNNKIITNKVNKIVNKNSISLNLATESSGSFHANVYDVNHSVDEGNHIAVINHTVNEGKNIDKVIEIKNNLQRYHTYSQICEQDSNCIIKKSNMTNSFDNTIDNSNQFSMFDQINDSYNKSNTSLLTQESRSIENSSELSGASYYLHGNSYLNSIQMNYSEPIQKGNYLNNSQKKFRESICSAPGNFVTPDGDETIGRNFNTPDGLGINILRQDYKESLIQNSSQVNEYNEEVIPLQNEKSESINSVLSNHEMKNNYERERSIKNHNLTFNNSNVSTNSRDLPKKRNELPEHEPMNDTVHHRNGSTNSSQFEILKSKIKRRSRIDNNKEKTSRSKSLVKNRHSFGFEIQSIGNIETIRRCKSLSNLASNELLEPKSNSFQMAEHQFVVPNCKSFLQSNLDLIEPPHFTSTPKKVLPPKVHQEIKRSSVVIEDQPTRSTDPPVSHWLRELSQRYEAEYMTAFQSKALISERLDQQNILSGPVSNYILNLQNKIRTISNEFTKLLRQIEKYKWELIGPLSQSLIGHINQFLTEYHIESAVMTEECELFRSEAFKEPVHTEILKKQISHLGKSFAKIVDQILFEQIKLLISTLEETKNSNTIITTISNLTKLGLDSCHLGTLVSRCNGVRAILSVCLEVPCIHVTICTLRCIAVLCSSVSCIRELEKCNGIEILSEIICDDTRDETVLSEAISVLAQITAPWLDNNHNVQGLNKYVDSFVQALTKMMRKQLNSETLLLISAALANLSFMEPQAIWSLQEYNSIGILLTSVRKLASRASVFLQEQTATLIANMAAVPEVRPSLAQNRAVVALLCFLQIRHSPLQRSSEIMAAERLQHKSAIALSRLCSDVEISRQVVELQGVNRLVKLCKEERERNHSDGVLVACLAALRKVTTNCGTGSVEELNAIELVEPKLLDSFMLYSSKQESYV